MKLEWRKLKRIYLAALLFGVCLGVACMLVFAKGYAQCCFLSLWSDASDIIAVVYPALATVPFCWCMYYERKDNYLSYVFVRKDRKKYIAGKTLVAAAMGGSVVFAASIASLLASLCFLPPGDMLSADRAAEIAAWTKMFAFGEFMRTEPIAYAIALSAWRFVLGSLYGVFGFLLSLYMESLFAVLTIPFVYGILENFILSILGFPQFRTVTSFVPTCLSNDLVSIKTMLVGPALLAAVMLAVHAYSKRKQDEE